jgi:RNA polymerase sigma factor (TIGR02999 family)
MRHLLVDRARAQLSGKHGGDLVRAELSEAEDFQVDEGDWVVALHEALRRLAKLSPRMAEVVECRVFSGYDDEQIAEALGVSPRTVQRDWTMARAWLRREVGEAGLKLA